MTQLRPPATDMSLSGGEILALAFDHEVKLVRRKYWDFASSLPADFQNVLEDHTRERQLSARGAPVFGELAGFLLADLMSVQVSVARELGLAWALMYEHALLVDDLVDRTDGDVPRRLLLSQLLLNRAAEEYRSSLVGHDHVWNSFLSHHREWLEGMAHELNHSAGNSMLPWDVAIKRQGEKAALVKVAAAAMVIRAKNRDLTAAEVTGIDHLCRGVQLLDDIGDLWEDHRGARINGVLVRAYERGRELGFSKSDLDYQHLLALVLESGALGSAWTAAAQEFESVISSLDPAHDGVSAEAMRAFARSSQENATLAKQAVRAEIRTSQDRGEAWEMRKRKLAETAAALLARGPTACQ